MSKTDGEYELVLGNRQLLSAFFIIVILFGVFFTMGYVVGRNSAPASAASAAPPSVTANVKPEAASPTSSQPATTPVTPPVDSVKEPAPTPVETKPVAPPEKVAEKPIAAPPAKHSAMSPAEKSLSKLAASSTGAPAVTPGPGKMYLQVAAVAQPQAGVVVDTLKQKGFPAFLSQVPNAALYRVLVGPYPDAAAAGKAKADLESAGFRPIVRK